MLTKVIFTIAVVLAVIFFSRLRRRPRLGVTASHRTAALPGDSHKWVRWLASAVVVLMVAGAALYLYLDWRDASEIVQVRVIDAGSGKFYEYKVYRGELEERSFRTTDGRRVVLAETERMETSSTFTPESRRSGQLP